MTTLSNTSYLARGTHIIADLYGVDPSILDNLSFLEETLKFAVTAAGATLLSAQSHRFDPQGVTVLLLLSESHMSIHTYPERQTAFIDVFTCGETCRPDIAVQFVTEALKAVRSDVRTFIRGNERSE